MFNYNKLAYNKAKSLVNLHKSSFYNFIISDLIDRLNIIKKNTIMYYL